MNTYDDLEKKRRQRGFNGDNPVRELDKGTRRLNTGGKVAATTAAVGGTVGAATAGAVGLGLIAKTTAMGSVVGPVGTAVGLIAGATAAGIGMIAGRKKKKHAKKEAERTEKEAAATEIASKKIGKNNDGYGLSKDGDAPSADINAPVPGETPAVATPETVSKTSPVDDLAGDNLDIKNTADGLPGDKLDIKDTSTQPLVDPAVTSAANTASNINTAGNIVNSGVAVAGLINSMSAKPVEKAHAQISQAPKEPEKIDDNTEAVRAMAQSQVQGNLGAAEKQMIEMGVNPAMAQSIKTSQGNEAALGINANLAQNKHSIQAANAQIGNQHNQFSTQVGMQNAQMINQTGQFNIQNQAQANQMNSQAIMQNLGALGVSTSNYGKIKLDKALMGGDLEMSALQSNYYKKLMGVKQ